MRQRIVIVLIAVVLIVTVVGPLLRCRPGEPTYCNYGRVQVGMSLAEVEGLLGPGTEVGPQTVPGIAVPVNPADAVASDERRRAGLPPVTARDYPTRIKPVVEGERVYKWVCSTGGVFLVSFTDGRVREQYYHQPNYLYL